MNPLDTLIWLVNFPASHGYVMVFIAGFSLFGLVAMSVRGLGGSGAALDRIRAREGLARPARRITGQFGRRIVRMLFRVLTVLMLGSLVIGILSLAGVPVTRAYIFDNGRPTTGTVDGHWITFTTAEGVEYTLESDFFTPAAYPDRDASFPTGQPVVVRYLPGHPQAFVSDSSQTPR
jgi:hypothetical protein